MFFTVFIYLFLHKLLVPLSLSPTGPVQVPIVYIGICWLSKKDLVSGLADWRDALKQQEAAEKFWQQVTV